MAITRTAGAGLTADAGAGVAGADAAHGGADRATSQAETARSRASASTPCKVRRIVDSLGAARRPRPSRVRTAPVRSWAHSAIAVNVRAPASTPQIPIASTATSP
jgi:hypothetical protein